VRVPRPYPERTCGDADEPITLELETIFDELVYRSTWSGGWG